MNTLGEQEAWAGEVAARAKRSRILSTLPFHRIKFWVDSVTTLRHQDEGLLSRLGQRLGLRDPGLILRLLREAPRHDLVLLTGGERTDLLYAAIAGGLCPWIRTPHVIVDAHWQMGTGISQRLQRWLLRMANRIVVQVQPHSVEENSIYTQGFGIPAWKMHAVPWSTSLTGHAFAEDAEDDGYVLTGGHSFRDYGPFLQAAGSGGWPVRIGIAGDRVGNELREAAARYPNIRLHTDWSNAQFIEQMGRCRVFAMPIAQKLTRSTADQTILNAMRMGRIVVSTDSIGPRIYLRDGENGMLVREPSPQAWRDALATAFSMPAEQRRRMAGCAREDAKIRFNETLRLARTLDAALDAMHALPDGAAARDASRDRSR